MDPEDRKLLRQIAEQVSENTKIVKQLQRKARWSTIIRVFYWVVIIILTFGSYYFIQPYIDQLSQIYTGFGTDVNTIKGATSGATDLLKNLGK